jgi:hypothetical protein
VHGTDAEGADAQVQRAGARDVAARRSLADNVLLVHSLSTIFSKNWY